MVSKGLRAELCLLSQKALTHLSVECYEDRQLMSGESHFYIRTVRRCFNGYKPIKVILHKDANSLGALIKVGPQV